MVYGCDEMVLACSVLIDWPFLDFSKLLQVEMHVRGVSSAILPRFRSDAALRPAVSEDPPELGFWQDQNRLTHVFGVDRLISISDNDPVLLGIVQNVNVRSYLHGRDFIVVVTSLFVIVAVSRVPINPSYSELFFNFVANNSLLL